MGRVRPIALIMIITLTGCSIPSYLVRSSDVSLAQAPAVRERDGAAVTLAGGSFMPTRDPPRADGRVRVRGTGRHNKTWRAGMIITLVGIPLAIGGAVLGVLSVAPGFGGYTGDPTEGPGSHITASGSAMLGFGLALGLSGDSMTLGVGPALWIAGAREKPLELRF
jgi:hypothetical protein